MCEVKRSNDPKNLKYVVLSTVDKEASISPLVVIHFKVMGGLKRASDVLLCIVFALGDPV